MKRGDKSYRSKKILEDLYWKEEMTIRDIAEMFGVCNSTILYQMVKNGVNRRNKNVRINESSNTNHLNLSDRKVEFIEGNLLGDGSIFKHGNICARYAHSEKNKKFLEWLSRKLDNFGIEQVGSLRKNDSELVEGVTYQYWSRSYVELTELRERWYSSGMKRIPPDLDITPIRLFNWYIGDDSLFPNGSCKIASTRPDSELKLIKNKLEDIGITCSVTSMGLYIWVESSTDFFEYIIRSNLYPPCYSYKFPDYFQ